MDYDILCTAKKKSGPNPDNWDFESLVRTDKAAPKFVKLPTSVDLEDKFPPVYTQIYGSCTSNAVLACDAYYYHRNKPNWHPSATFLYYNQLKYDHALKYNDPYEGSTVESALEVTRKKGVCNAKIWPNESPWNERPSDAAYENGLKGREVTKYYRIKNLQHLKMALNDGCPVPSAIAWCFKYYDSNYIMNTPTKKEAKNCDRGHAIVFVGYDDSKKLIKFRNSWSKEWGKDGYGFITYDTAEMVIWFDDTYAITK